MKSTLNNNLISRFSNHSLFVQKKSFSHSNFNPRKQKSFTFKIHKWSYHNKYITTLCTLIYNTRYMAVDLFFPLKACKPYICMEENTQLTLEKLIH